MAKGQNAKNIAEKVELLIRDTVEKMDYILWDVEYKKEGSDYNLIVTLDREGEDLTIDDCVAVTDALNPILDENDPIPDSYCLEVSSAGLERDLRKPFHFEKYLGEPVEVKLFAPLDGVGKNFVAPLISYTENSYTFSIGGEEKTLESTKVALVKTYVDYADIFKNN